MHTKGWKQAPGCQPIAGKFHVGLVESLRKRVTFRTIQYQILQIVGFGTPVYKIVSFHPLHTGMQTDCNKMLGHFLIIYGQAWTSQHAETQSSNHIKST